MTPAATLKALRLRAKLTQKQLADKAGIDRSWYNQMERGKRAIGPSPAAKLARALGVSPVEFGVEAEAEEEYRSLGDRLAEVAVTVGDLLQRQKKTEREMAHLRAQVQALEAPGAAVASAPKHRRGTSAR